MKGDLHVMKQEIMTLQVVILSVLLCAGCSTNETTSADQTATRDRAVQIASTLHIGMSEHEAIAILKTQGVFSAGGAGGSDGWFADCPLSDGSTLRLVIVPKTPPASFPPWSNGVLRSACVLIEDEPDVKIELKCNQKAFITKRCTATR